MTRRRATLLCSLVVVVAAAACGSSDDDAASTSTSTSASAAAMPTTADTAGASTAPTESAAPSTTTVPDDVRAALDEVLGWMADPATLDPFRFSAELLAQVPADELTAALASIGRGVWTASDIVVNDEGVLEAVVTGPAAPLRVQLSLDDAGAIDGLLFRPALADPPTTLTALADRVSTAAEITGYLVADVAPDGTCQARASVEPDRPIAIGSVFKLYVLGALASAIEAGTVAWDQPITIRDELDSLPSGTTQDEPAGSTLPVRELAQRMIEVSDNTATDHLIDLVGRDAVETALVDLGHADPAVTRPMVTTRELFVLKADLGLLARYEAADEAGRRELLAGEVATAPLPDPSAFWTEPRAVDTVEWFASPADICRALVALSDRASTPGLEPIAEILSTNPGVPVDPARFSRVLFKGGGEPGVLSVAWLGTRPDGTRLAVTGGAVDTTAELDPTVVELLALGLTVS